MKVSTYIIWQTNKLNIQIIETLLNNILVYKNIKLWTYIIISSK